MPTARTPKKPAREDWTQAYISYRVREAGTSLRKLSRKHNFAPSALSVSLWKPWPNAQRLIADAIGVAPQEIWPSRYEPDGTPKKGLRSKLRSPARPAPVSVRPKRSIAKRISARNGNVAAPIKQEGA